MFQNLTRRLSTALTNVSGKSKLTEDNIRGALREVRISLLEADVALNVVKEFTNKIRKRAVGLEVKRSLKPGQVFVKIVNEELVALMGYQNDTLELNCQPPAVILLAGLQGAGKTTTAAKLAMWLKNNMKKSPLLTSTDIYRPSAIEQLKTLSEEHDLAFSCDPSSNSPKKMAAQALKEARLQHHDVLIVDTAGRLHVDADMMDEIKELHGTLHPIETLFVIDAMAGQDAANTAKAFGEALDLTGVVLTKVDGDARGGAALSVRYVTGKPIKFMGTGEKIEGFELFHPERIASRILGMGDMLSLLEEAERSIDKKQADKLVKKIKKGKNFSLEDLQSQIKQLDKMGGITNLLDKLPGFDNLGKAVQMAKQNMGNSMFSQIDAIINSMTVKEKQNPDIINGSRKKRIANGSGVQIQDVNRLLKQHKQMGKMMKKMNGKGGTAMLRSLQGS